MENSCVLIVDDDTAALESLIRGLATSEMNARFYSATNADKALKLQEQRNPGVAVIDLSLNKTDGVESGFELLRSILKNDPGCRVIVLTGHAGIEHGVRALALGAAHFLSKPANLEHLNALIRDSLDQSLLRRALSRYQGEREHELVDALAGTSPVAKKLRKEISYAAQTAQPVFIRGETGTGKGLCAWLIHQMSPARAHAFIRYQPLFSSPDLVNSDLFGHKRGAFTGASDQRHGLLLAAHQGTLFLDEIDELPHETQVALLGVLHDRTFRALGDNQVQHSDFRLISASNASIEEKLEKGMFRRDLFHRIAHYQIEIPPLRERLEDIPDLTIRTISQIRNRYSISVDSMSTAANSKLATHDWPGNIRELEAVIESALWRAQYRGSPLIDAEDITLPRTSSSANASERNFHARVKEFESQLVKTALSECSGSLSSAARVLGIDRGTVKRISERT